jgi:hypothetical protein
MGPWEPLKRDEQGVKDWTKKRLKTSINNPQDLVAIKCLQGDKSDNLPPGTPPDLIDLLNIRPRHSVFNTSLVGDILRIDLKNSPKSDPILLKKAKEVLAYYVN